MVQRLERSEREKREEIEAHLHLVETSDPTSLSNRLYTIVRHRR